jgi:hypothetical protein
VREFLRYGGCWEEAAVVVTARASPRRSVTLLPPYFALNAPAMLAPVRVSVASFCAGTQTAHTNSGALVHRSVHPCNVPPTVWPPPALYRQVPGQGAADPGG